MYLKTLEAHLSALVVQRPANVLEVRVVQKVVVEFLHPDADLCHANGSDLGQRVPLKTIQHTLNFN
jgi:hypothetical protein